MYQWQRALVSVVAGNRVRNRVRCREEHKCQLHLLMREISNIAHDTMSITMAVRSTLANGASVSITYPLRAR